MSVSVVVLAAGLGTRMKSAKAKVLHEICGKAMILHILREAYELSDDVSVVLFHQKEAIERVILEEFPQTKIIEQDHANYPGTGGALRNFTPKHDKIVILCGDMPLITANSIKKLTESKADIAVAVFESEVDSYGRVIIERGEVKEIIENKDATAAQKAIKTRNSGVYVMKRAILSRFLPQISKQNAQNEYYLTDIIALSRENKAMIEAIFVEEIEFMGVNDKIQLEIAENAMQERIKHALMSQGVRFHNAKSSFISTEAVFEGECEIYENVRIEGRCLIANSVIKSGCVIENSVVEGSFIGPLAHLRPKCEVVNSHIGNFVECKNAKLRGVKAGHLSYLGDCEVGEGSNIGCGTITCNYDGREKHRTIIGQNVFVGSDTQLIAPVQVADNAIIAAGSCVSVDVPSGALFINRAERKIIKDYFYKKFGENGGG